MPEARKRKAKAKPTAVPLAKLPKVGAMDAYVAATPRAKQLAALENAQATVYKAWESSTEDVMLRRCLRAVEISPLCADAYNALADRSSTAKRRLALYELAVAAGERALGSEGFEEFAGEFWGWLETRPYMRARAGLAMVLREMDRADEAIGHYWATLELNPGDNQGIRYVLLAALLGRRDTAGVRELFKKFEGEGSIHFRMTEALLAYQEGRGESEEARAAVAASMKRNKHVVPILTGQERLAIHHSPLGVLAGGPDEATEYVVHAGAGWYQTDGALAWLRTLVDQQPVSE